MDTLDLHKVSETATKLTLGHAPVPGAAGFRLSPVVKAGVVQPGKWAHTWDGTRTEHVFAVGHPPYRVEALEVGAVGVYPHPPVNVTAPTITGLAAVGETLTAQAGSWTGD